MDTHGIFSSVSYGKVVGRSSINTYCREQLGDPGNNRGASSRIPGILAFETYHTAKVSAQFDSTTAIQDPSIFRAIRPRSHQPDPILTVHTGDVHTDRVVRGEDLVVDVQYRQASEGGSCKISFQKDDLRKEESKFSVRLKTSVARISSEDEILKI